MAARGEEGRMYVSEMLRGVDKQASIRRCPNGETRLAEMLVHSILSKLGIEERTQGIETS